MEIQTKPLLKVKTPRIKCILTHKNYSYVIICFFTGEIQIYDPKTTSLKKSIQICNVPIRSGAIIPSKDWILLGNDEGRILVLDIGSLAIIDSIKAHDDFIRKIAVDEENFRFVTVSDDNRTKLWGFKNEIVLINKYKDSKHFVMDACFYPADHSQFLTVSLDGRIRLYSVTNTKCIKSFKGHERGINTIAFLDSNIFVTGSDDNNIMIWDIKRTLPITVLKGHTKAVNKIKVFKSRFASCSEDSSIRLWNEEYKTYEVIHLEGRIWDINYKDGKVFIGSDEELGMFGESGQNNLFVMSENRIFYILKDRFCSSKLDELGACKELGTIDTDFKCFTANANGKLVAVEQESEFTIFSTLGLRKKFSDTGKSVRFFGQDSFVYAKEQRIVLAAKNNILGTKEILGLNEILYADETFILANCPSTSLFSLDFDLKNDFLLTSKNATIINGFFILMNHKINIFSPEFKNLASLDYEVEYFAVDNNVVFFNTKEKSFYLIVENMRYYVQNIRFNPGLIGAKQGILYYMQNTIKTAKLDIEFLEFQRNYLLGLNPKPSENITDKAISFIECLGDHEIALSLCSDDNQRFEILLKLERLEEAFRSANSPIKFEKLGKKFYQIGDMKNSAECFYKSNNINNLLLVDVFGEKKYLDYVGKMALKCGKNNVAFLAYYKQKKYDICKNLLKDSPFYQTFCKFY